MIFKSFNVEKNISLIDNLDAVLFYGENIGLKDDFKNYIKKHNKDVERISLFQNDIIKNPEILNEEVLNTSLFSVKKIIFINDYSEKLKKQIMNVIEKLKSDVKIFIFAENLDRKSIIRSHFENEKKLGIVPCYQDNEKTLSIYLMNKLKEYRGLSQELTNFLIKNSGTDRKVLSQEIEKIKGLFLNKTIEEEKVIRLINEAYNIDFDNLRDSCLSNNKEDLNKNLGNISLQSEKAYFYLGTLNSRIQKLLSLNELLDKNKNIDVALDSIKPRIFWKDKPILKTQLKIWNIEKLERAKKIILESEIVIKTKMNSLSDILIKKLLIEIYMIGNSTS